MLVSSYVYGGTFKYVYGGTFEYVDGGTLTIFADVTIPVKNNAILIDKTVTPWVITCENAVMGVKP